MFQACGAVNVETGDMFLRITQNGLSQRLSRSGALTSACLHVHVGRALLFLFPCRSQRCHDISRIGSSQKVIRIALHAHATHFLSFRAKTKLHKKRREACKSSWNPRGNQKSFTLTIPWNSAKLLNISPGIIARLHHTD